MTGARQPAAAESIDTLSSPGQPLRALVVGTGFGCRIQVPALRGAGFEVAGLVGSDPARTAGRAAANGVPGSFTDLDEAIARTGAEVVAISTPPDSHAPLALKALARGCHVLCEKPFAYNASDARAMLEAARRAGKVHMIGHEFRFQPQRATVARAIADGMIGEPRLVSLVQFLPHIPTYESAMPGWWFDPAQGGGWLGASGSHVIDQLRSWLGEFDTLSASLSAVTVTRGPVDDSFALRFRMARGVEGVIQYSAGASGPVQDIARIAGSKGTIWIDGGTVRFADRSGERALLVPEDLVLPPAPPVPPDPRHAEKRWQMLVSMELPPYTQLCRTMKAAILGEPAPSPVVAATFADGVACMQVMDAVRSSATREGALVAVQDF